MSEFPSLLRLNNTLFLYIHICSLIHDGHLGCFHLLALWRITLLGTWLSKYLWETLLSVLLGVYPAVALLIDVVVLLLMFWGIALLSFLGATPLYLLTRSALAFWFLHILTNTCYFPGCWIFVFWCFSGLVLFIATLLVVPSQIRFHPPPPTTGTL